MRLLRLHRAILAELAAVFLLALLVVVSVLFTGQSVQALSKWQGLGFSYLWSLLPSLLPVAFAYGMPYAFLLAVALVYGRMVSDREIVAIGISGIHPKVAVAPVVMLGAVLSVISLAFNGWLLPSAWQSLRRQEMNLADIFIAALAGSEEGITLPQCRLSFGSYVPAAAPGGNGEFREFEMDQRDRDGALARKVFAKSARLRREGDDLVLESDLMWVFVEDAEGGTKKSLAPRRLSVGRVESLDAKSSFREFLGASQFERKARDVELPDLLYLTQRGDIPKVPKVRSMVELHGRLAGSASPLVFGLVAVGMGLQLSSRSRRLTGFLLAFLPVLLVHFPLLLAGRALSDSGRVPAWVGMWLGDAVLLAGAAFLLRRAYVR